MSRSMATLLSLVGLGLTGCEGVELYDVTRTSLEQCEIRPNGEFCGDTAPAVSQLFAVERRETHTFVHFEEETWVAEGTEGERAVEKLDLVTREPGPCTTTLRRTLRFSENGADFTGTLEIATRVEGPEACGETPRGERSVYSLAGARTNSI